MTMPAVIEIVDSRVSASDIEKIFTYWASVDDRFSTFKPASEVSHYNASHIPPDALSPELQEVLRLSAETKLATKGFFDIQRDEKIDPSGLVKGWAIERGAQLFRHAGFKNFYLEISGDIQVDGHDAREQPWRIGIRHPFDKEKIIKVVQLSNHGVATSGTYERGQHIYNPLTKRPASPDIVSLTVIGSNIFEADRFATAAFAMGRSGINFIEQRPDLEGYMIDATGTATMTSGWNSFVITS